VTPPAAPRRGRPPALARAAAQWLAPAPIDRSALLTPQVYRALRAAIVQHRLAPGDALNEGDIAEHLAVSRTPVREALQRLVHEGLVDVRPRSGTRVAPLDLKRVEEGMLVREALEATAMQAAARQATPADVQRLADLNQRLEQAARAGDAAAYVEHDDRFHAGLLQLSGYPSIAGIIDEVNAHLDRVRAMSGALPERMPQSAHEHRAILAALARQDGPAAAAAMREHLAAAWTVVRRLAADMAR
jgi:GntR family transcriptional regulator, rspAB operon transcriptional repressor